MTLQYLFYIVEVAKYGSITKAAEKNYVSQPYISKIIKSIEDEIGITIFIRTRTGIQITEEGAKFLNYAQSITKQVDDLSNMYSSKKPQTTHFRVSSARSSHVSEAFVQLVEEYQSIERLRFHFKESNTLDVIESVCSKAADIGLFFITVDCEQQLAEVLSSRGLEYRVLSAPLNRYIITSANHPLAKLGRPIKIEELYQYGMVKHGDYGNINGGTKDFISDFKIFNLEDLDKIIYTYDRGALLNVLSNTDYFAIGIQRFSSQGSMYGLTCLEIDKKSIANLLPKQKLVCVYSATKCFSAIEHRFIEIISQKMK